MSDQIESLRAFLVGRFDGGDAWVTALDELQAEVERLTKERDTWAGIAGTNAGEAELLKSWQASIRAEIGEPPYLAEHRIPAMTHGKYFDYVNLEYANHFKHAAEHLAAKLVEAQKDLEHKDAYYAQFELVPKGYVPPTAGGTT